MEKLICILFLPLLLIIVKLFSPIHFNTHVNYIGNYISKLFFVVLGRFGCVYVSRPLPKSVNFMSDLIDVESYSNSPIYFMPIKLSSYRLLAVYQQNRVLVKSSASVC